MSARQRDDTEAQTVVQEHEPRVRSRRTLLGAAGGCAIGTAGGHALSAAGLWLPNGLADAEAREGAFGGVLGGRHGKNRRGRGHQHRRGKHHDRSKDRGAPKSGSGTLGPEGELKITFVLINDSAVEIDSTCFYYTWDSQDCDNCSFGHDDKTVPAGESVEFVTNVKKAALWFDHDRHHVWAKNPFFGYPVIEIFSAGGRGGAGPKNMAVGDTLSWRHGIYQIEVKRQDDYQDHKVFWVHYNKK